MQSVHAEELVWCVVVFVCGGEREEDGIEAHVALEEFGDGHGAAHAYEQRVDAVDRVQGGIGRLEGEMIGRDAGKGSKTLESVTAYLDNRPGLSFRVNGTQRGPWRIPTECSAEMERKLSKQDIERVLATMRTK